MAQSLKATSYECNLRISPELHNVQLIMTSDGELPSAGNIKTLTKEKLNNIETMVDDELGTYSIVSARVR